jgi:hypothetical protein
MPVVPEKPVMTEEAVRLLKQITKYVAHFDNQVEGAKRERILIEFAAFAHPCIDAETQGSLT